MATVLPMKGWKSCGSRAETGRATSGHRTAPATAPRSSAVRLSPWARTVAGATETTADTLADEPSWREWAAQHDVVGDATARDLERLRDLRESIRAGLLANHDRTPLPERTRAALDDAMRWSRARSEFSASGLRLRPEGEGATQLAGSVIAATAAALADGTWSRLKACRDDTCRWAFYDHSRSRTGQWCSMEICGNRNKQARWRQRKDEVT